mgnify:CR=1 FL=1
MPLSTFDQFCESSDACKTKGMAFVGILVAVATAVARPPDPVTVALYRTAAAMLLAMAALTASTGARGSVAWFKACALIKTGVAVTLLIASLL